VIILLSSEYPRVIPTSLFFEIRLSDTSLFDEPGEGAYDNNSDGIIDTPYNIPGGFNQDLYPFMEQNGWLDDIIDVFADPSQVLLGRPTTVVITVLCNGEPYEGVWVSLIGQGIDINDSTLPDGTTTFSITPASTGSISIKVNNVTTNTTIEVVSGFIYVDDDYNTSTPDWGYTRFDSIQDGVDAVIEDGMVFVFNGTYYENVVVEKTISLVGENRNNTVIDGIYNDDVVSIFADNVSLTGFLIQHSGSEIGDNAILIQSNNNYICENNILNNSFGIKIDSSDSNFIMDNNISFNNWEGIYLLHSSSNNTIKNNVLFYNNCGIYLLHSGNNMVSGNYVKCYDHGITLGSSSNNNISHNIIIGNDINPIENHGIQLYKSNNNKISYNEINYNSRNGINIRASCENLIINNNITSNINYGISIEITTGVPSFPSNDNIIRNITSYCNIRILKCCSIFR